VYHALEYISFRALLFHSSGYALLTVMIIPGVHTVIVLNCRPGQTNAMRTSLVTITQPFTSGCCHKGLQHAQMGQRQSP